MTEHLSLIRGRGWTATIRQAIRMAAKISTFNLVDRPTGRRRHQKTLTPGRDDRVNLTKILSPNPIDPNDPR